MPIYEYKCGTCDRRFEVMRRRSEANDRADCPRCGPGRQTRRVMSTFSGRSASSSGPSGDSHSVAGTGGCGGCRKSSCAGCRH